MRPGLVAAALLWGACGAGDPETGDARRLPSGAQSAQAGAEVVARVGEDVVTVADVRALSAATELSPRDATERLVQERLLASEANRRGYGDDPEVKRAVRNAAAHALIRARVESPWTVETLPKALVDEACAEAIDAESKPQQRRADHVLFPMSREVPEAEDARGRQAATRVAEALRRADDVEAVLARFENQTSLHGVPMKVERLPAAPREGVFVEPFSEALFSLASPGAVSAPVRSEFGWHAIVLREIMPPTRVAREDVEEGVRERLLLVKRREALQALVKELRTRLAPHYEEDNFAHAFASDVGAPP